MTCLLPLIPHLRDFMYLIESQISPFRACPGLPRHSGTCREFGVLEKEI